MIVALDGPDGAGKSTQVTLLREWAEEQGRTLATVGKWDIFRDGAVPQARFLRGTDQRDLRTCIAEMPDPSRMLFLGWMNTTAATRAAQSSADIVLLDGYWAKHAATELLAGCNPDLVHAITAAIAPVDLIVYMDVDPHEALRRKGTDLSPYECGCDPTCSPDRFLEHQTAVREVLLGWAAERHWSVVHPGPVEDVQAQLRDHIGRALAGTGTRLAG